MENGTKYFHVKYLTTERFFEELLTESNFRKDQKLQKTFKICP